MSLGLQISKVPLSLMQTDTRSFGEQRVEQRVDQSASSDFFNALRCAARKPAAQGRIFLDALRHDSAALDSLRSRRANAKSCPDTCLVDGSRAEY